MRTLTLSQSNLAFSSFSERLAFAKQRVDELEQYRIQKVQECCDDAFLQVFTLLPLILHYNHPALPAYVENAPCGISQFQYQPFQTSHFADLALEDLPIPNTTAFDGLYAMGSIGSISQTRFSDLDLWLCHSLPFNDEKRALVQQKCEQVKQWAKGLGVEISLFLMEPSQFRAYQYRDDANDEHNGSAQHFFLLDEFYRSAIRLAGKRILWLHIDKQGQNYAQLIEQAVKNGELNANDWVDFGDFSSLSTNEFFGASLWQLYKGIESPHKSLIKILMLESCAQTYPKTDLISKKFKKLLLSNCGVSYHFDPYLAMLEQVTAYLGSRNENERLLCLRRCFYLKAARGQIQPLRLALLRELGESWGWAETEIERLNLRSEWKIKQVVTHHQMLIDQLLQSYRHLLNFARKFKLDPSILPQDADFLMRQLYSAFEPVPGKIPLLNECNRYDLSEKDITFIEVSEGGSVKDGWYMVNHAPFASYDSTTRYVFHGKSLIQAIAWGYFNGLITATTTVHSMNPRVSLPKLRQFITDLRLSFPVKVPKPQREDLNHPNEIRNLIVAINLANDPTHKLSNREKIQLNPFNLSSSGENVIGSLSIIYRNMWNEVMTQHFEGEGALLKSLKFISNKIYRSSAPPQSVNVFGYSQRFANELQDFVLNLVNRCITVKTGSIFQRTQPQVVQVAGQKWQLVFNQRQELKEIVPEPEQSVGKCCQTVPAGICAFASEGFLQFFFEDNPNGSFNVYVLDKQNKSECYHYCQGAKEDKIKEISRLYTESERSGEETFNSFNFPQFYQLLPSENGEIIVPFQSKQHRDFLNKQTIKEEVCQQSVLN